jgi:hypothetical protein
LLEGATLKQVMFDTYVYWKDLKTAWKYIRLLEVLGPFKYDKESVNEEQYSYLNSLPVNKYKSCVRAFEM